MCILSNLYFPLDKDLNLPPVGTIHLKCSLAGSEFDSYDIKENSKDIIYPFAASSVSLVPVSSASVLCDGDDVKTIIELVLDVSELNLSYLPGDTIGILPKNNKDEVEYIIARLGLNATDRYKVEAEKSSKKGIPNHIPPVATVEYMLGNCLDLRAIVKKALLRILAEHTSDVTEKRRIIELCSREGVGEYNEYILKPKASIIDVLQTFSSCNPPLSLLIEHIPRLQPRPYSIASSPLEDPSKLRIVFNIVHDSRNRRGICSGWLLDVTRPFHDLTYNFSQVALSGSTRPTVQIPIYLRKPSSFRIPETPSIPLIMIGTGTGIAPFVGFIEHRRKSLINYTGDQGENWIFFGCRHKNKDDIFRKQFESWEKENLCLYQVSYSRDECSSHPKYVQDIMRAKEKDLIEQLSLAETVMFICGNGQTMVRDVIESLVHLVANVRGISEAEAKEFVVLLEKNGRIVKEVWS